SGPRHLLCDSADPLATGDVGTGAGPSRRLPGRQGPHPGAQTAGAVRLPDLDVRLDHRGAGLPDAVPALCALISCGAPPAYRCLQESSMSAANPYDPAYTPMHL